MPRQRGRRRPSRGNRVAESHRTRREAAPAMPGLRCNDTSLTDDEAASVSRERPAAVRLGRYNLLFGAVVPA